MTCSDVSLAPISSADGDIFHFQFQTDPDAEANFGGHWVPS